MGYSACIKLVGFGIVAAASVALTACGSSTGGGGGSTGSTGSTGASGSTGSGGGDALTCDSNFCTFGMGGYAFSYADGDPPATPTGMSHATLDATGKLCISGSTMALPAAPTADDYSNDWGAGIGVNLNQAMSGPDGGSNPKMAYTLTGTGVTVKVTGLPACATTVRLVLDQNGAMPEYCAPLTTANNGTETPWASFNTACWDGSGTALSGPPTSQAIKVQIVTTATACTYTNVCIADIKL